MNKGSTPQSGVFNPRVLLAFVLSAVGVLLAMLSFAAHPPSQITGPAGSSPGDSRSVGKYVGQLGGKSKAAAPSVPVGSVPMGGWSIVTSPNPITTEPSFLSGVTCVSASDCWAVGYYNPYSASIAYQTLIERWDGISWIIVTSPDSSATERNFLYSVTCASASDCWAVGYYEPAGNYDRTLIERWDGTSWTIVTSPNPNTTQNNRLLSVTCASASDCWAVGNSYNGGSVAQTLIERWNGTSWAIITSPNSGAENFLNGVTCMSTSDCWAVGNSSSASAWQTLIERWDGNSWAIVTSPNPSATRNSALLGVTCASASECWAVGSHSDAANTQTLIERWNGNSWVLVTSPNGSTTGYDYYNYLFGVTCAAASDCWAVGYYYDANNAQTLIERWDGTAWTIVAPPDALPTLGVTCASASECWAVGYYSNSYKTLIERWDGTSWAIVTSPNPNATRDNYLYGATCTSASDCWAVGYYSRGGAPQTLIERWNGDSWAIVTSPNATGFNFLNSVTCVSASDCWAVGNYDVGGGVSPQTLIERWNGNSWTIFSSANTSALDYNVLQAVTCLSASDCWAIGSYAIDGGAGPDQTLIEHWNGASWAIVASPNSSAKQNNDLYGVACASANDCWAVGYYYTTSNAVQSLVAQTLVERWDGTSWSIVTSPNTSPVQSDLLLGVTCVSTSDCWAVGQSTTIVNAVRLDQTLIERWDGTSWTIVNSPNTSPVQSDFLLGVTCTSASNCWAVGYYDTGSAGQSGANQTLIERWDGTSWAIVTSPNNSATQGNLLNGVTCASASDCWAVGLYDPGTSLPKTLTEHYAAPIVSKMTHGSAGTFDIDLPLTGNRGVECRTSASLGAGYYRMVFTFANNLIAVGSASASGCGGSVSSNGIGPNPNQYTVNLAGVSNACYIVVTLTNVIDSAANFSSAISGTMGVLVGDVNANGVVTNADVSLVKAQVASGASVDSSNFRDDINANGVLSNADVSLTKAQVAAGAQLPTPP